MSMRTALQVLVLAIVLVTAGVGEASANANNAAGLTGRTNRPGDSGAGCTGCHVATSAGQVPAFFVRLTGPATLRANTSGTYAVQVFSQNPAAGASTLASNLNLGAAITASDPGTVLAKIAGTALTPVTRGDGVTELIHSSAAAALQTTAGGTASYSFTYTMPAGATAGSTHTLHAVARVGVGQLNGAWAHAAALPVITAPPTPGSLTATGATTTSVSLSWSGSGPGYRIVYKPGSSAPASEADGSFVDLGDVTTTTITGLTANTQYSFRVFSRSTSGTAVYTIGGSVTRSTAPAITSSLAQINGTVGVAITSYTITAPGATTFGATNLPPGVNIAGAVISGTPTNAGSYSVTLTASNTNGSDSQAKNYVIAAGSQTVSFGTAPTPSYSPGGTFAVSATATSGLPVTYSSNTTGVCTVGNPSVGTVTIVTAGLCIIRADQAGSPNFGAAFNTQNITIAAVAPAAPTPGTPVPGNGTLAIPFTPPSNNGGSAITGYSASCTPSGSANSTVSPIAVSGLANDVLHTCTVRAINAVGPGALSTPVTGTPRADPDGQLDPSFGTGGISVFAFSGAPGATVNGMAVSNTGSIVVVGQTTGGTQDFAVARFAPNGVLDTKFNNTGMVITDFGGNDIAYGAAVYENGRVLVVGHTSPGGPNGQVAMVRYTSTGELDSSFGVGGRLAFNIGKANLDVAYSVVLDRDERIHIAGQSFENGVARFFVARVLADGLDGSFGTGGATFVPAESGGALRVMFDSQRRLVAAGFGTFGSYAQMLVARFTGEGSLDTSFAGVGYAARDFGDEAQAFALAFGPGDAPIVTGPAFTSGNSDYKWTQFGADGSIGPVYSLDVTPPRTDQARGIIRQSDGKVVLAGITNTNPNFDYGLARFAAGGSLDSSFGAGGRTITSVGASDVVGIGALDHQYPGTVVVAGNSDSKMVVLRYLLDAPAGIAFTPPAGPIGTTTFVTSNAVTITNTALSVYVQVTNGFYSIDCNPNGFTTARGEIAAGQAICVRHLTANNPGGSVTTTLVVGGQSATFTSTTTFDATPDPFGFVDQANVAPGSTVTSNAITVAGINGASPISVSGGSYSIGCTGTFVTAAGTINNGQSVCVRHTAAAGFSAQVDTVLTIGGVFDIFSSVTVGADTTPDAFTFTDVTNVTPGSIVTSNAVTVAGITAPAAISVTGGTYSIGCTASFTAVAGTIANGQTVCVRHPAAAGFSSATNTQLTIGGVSDTFTSTTAALDSTPNAFTFTDVTNATPGVDVTSNAVTIAGINTLAAISVTGGTYSIGCNASFTAVAGTIANGETVCVRHTTSASPSTATNTTLTIGGVADTFTSTTMASLPPGGDQDGDGIPNGVEAAESRNPFVKDNDVFNVARLFAMQQYRDFLGREGDPGGITFYTDGINGGTSRAQVIENFFNSPEFSGSVSPIVRLYFATFLRIPDYPGLNFQVDAFRSGTPLAVIANNFTLSPEFQATYGALSNTEFVALLYQNILGRTGAPPEIDFHVARLTSGETRGTVLVGFSESPEYKQLTANDVYVTMMYVGMLRRAPEQSGFDFWVDYMEAGNSGQALIAGFLNAPEYRNRFLP